MRGRRTGGGRIVYGALLVLWCLTVWRLSASSDPEELVGVRLPLPDKIEHAIEYAAGGFLAYGVMFPSRRLRPWIAAVCFCAAWGASDEIHQGFVPGRDSSGMDLAADVAGAALGATAFGLRPWKARPEPQARGRTDDESGDMRPADRSER